MKHTKIWFRAVLIILCLISAIGLISCSVDMNVGNNTALCEQFLDCLIEDDYDTAYSLMKYTVTPSDFHNYWATVKPLTNGTTDYDLEQIGWNINKSNGLTTRTTAYQVYLNNGKTLMLRVVTRDDIEGIAGMNLSDATAFLQETQSFVPTVSIILIIVSLLTFAFVIWMFVDCLRRKIKCKVLWAILIFVGVAITVTTGEQSGINFMLGLMLQTNTISADPSILSVVAKFVIPVGAIVYLCLRKKLTVCEPAETVEAFEVPSANNTETAEETPSADETEKSDATNE